MARSPPSNATLAGTDLAAVKRATESLNQGTVEFAARRMDLSVKKALTGHRLDELEL
jgi:molecular chaperone HscA